MTVAPGAETRLAELLADRTPIDYREFARMIDRDPQSLRTALTRRNKHVKEHGKARPRDIPEPAGYRSTRERRGEAGQGSKKKTVLREPWWHRNTAVKWAMRTGKLEPDGVTVRYYREGNKDRIGKAA
jgi:hypothetical protein